MKSNKKFPPELRAIIDQALKDKSAWIGKTVQELTCEAIKKRGINQEDILTNKIKQTEKDEFPYYKNIQEIADYIKRNKKQ